MKRFLRNNGYGGAWLNNEIETKELAAKYKFAKYLLKHKGNQ